MSASMPIVLPPYFCISSASLSSLSLRRATTATAAPCRASAFAVASPIPLLAPVTNATVPSSLSAIRNPPRTLEKVVRQLSFPMNVGSNRTPVRHQSLRFRAQGVRRVFPFSLLGRGAFRLVRWYPVERGRDDREMTEFAHY